VIVLDEPTEGLAPVIVQKIGDVIRMLKERGFTIILVEQSFHFVAKLADKSYIMENGRIVDQFDQLQLSANISKIHAYLGL
jgi:branched-chain amino acid transport system ATP-binding protein